MTRQRATNALVLILLLPERSAVNATLVLSRSLLRLGYRVVYFGSQAVEKHIVEQGFECAVIDFYGEGGFAEGLDRPGSLGWGARARREVRTWSVVYRRVHGQIREWLAANRPDVVLLDQLMWSYGSLFLEIGVPVLGLSTTLASVRDTAVPPVFSSFVAGSPVRPWARVRNFLAWMRLDVAFWLSSLHHGLLLRTSRDRLGWRGLDPRESARRLGCRLLRGEYGYRLQVPELVLAPPELDFPCAVQAHPRCYAGACVDPSRRDVPFPWSEVDPRRTLIYCSLGTYSHRYRHAHRLFHAAIEAVRRRPEWQLVLHTGEGVSHEPFRPLPENVVLVAEAPQLALLERAAIAITHGGLSSVREAIFYGVPMIVFPCWCDQRGNGARVRFYHLGLTGDIQQVDAPRLSGMIEHLLADATCRDAVKRMSQAFRRREDCRAAVELIEGLLGEPTEVPAWQALIVQREEQPGPSAR